MSLSETFKLTDKYNYGLGDSEIWPQLEELSLNKVIMVISVNFG